MHSFSWTPADLRAAIDKLPKTLHGDGAIIWPHTSDVVQPVIRKWAMMLPLRHQGVLLTALRGCDGAGKEDKSKALTSMVRRAVMNPADDRETSSPRGFFGFEPNRLFTETMDFLHSLDGYPFHYIMHLLHACEVIAYHHPSENFRQFFLIVYAKIVHSMHLEPESIEDMDERLTDDRVAKGTVERDFVNTSTKPGDYDPTYRALDGVCP